MSQSPAIPIFDSHLDLAWSALSFDRDLRLGVSEIRQREAGMTDERCRGRNTVSLPELKSTPIPVCVATLLSRSSPEAALRPDIRRSDLDHATQLHAHADAMAQLTFYQLLQRQGHLRILHTASELRRHWAAPRSLGIILSMEGADPITSPEELGQWYELGLRAIGPAHYGRSHYAYGTASSGPLSSRGIELLRAMDDLGMILDVTHLCDVSLAQALDYFDGPVLASHHNCRALVSGDRQLADGQIRQLVGRGAVIGVALDAWMLYPGWVRGQTPPSVVSLAAVADQIDHISQISGDCLHVAIGSDLDGGFGTEQTPRDLDTIADLQKLAPILESRGYTAADIARIFHGNWLAFFERHLPQGDAGDQPSPL